MVSQVTFLADGMVGGVLDRAANPRADKFRELGAKVAPACLPNERGRERESERERVRERESERERVRERERVNSQSRRPCRALPSPDEANR